MSRFDEMINGLRDDMVIPENVWRGYVRTLETLPEKGRSEERRVGKECL